MYIVHRYYVLHQIIIMDLKIAHREAEKLHYDIVLSGV